MGGRVPLVGLPTVEAEPTSLVSSWAGSLLAFVSVGVGAGEGAFESVCHVRGPDDGTAKRLAGRGRGSVFNTPDESKAIGEPRATGMPESDCLLVSVLLVALGGTGALLDGVAPRPCCVVEGLGPIGVVELRGPGREYDEGLVSRLLLLDCLGPLDGFGRIFTPTIDGIEDGLRNDEADKDLCRAA